MNWMRLLAWGLALLVGPLGPATVRAQSKTDGLKQMEVSLEPSSPAVEAATTATRDTLAGMHFSPPSTAESGAPHFVTAEDGRGILIGDFAGDGSNEALVELPASGDGNTPGVAFARWHAGQWEVRGLWAVSPVWRAAGWKESEEDHLPVTPAEQPFWIEHLEGDPAPWIVMAGEVWKYWQEHFVLRVDAKTGRLELLDSAMGKPEFLPGGWLRLYFNSGHRAIYEEWRFLRWQTGALATRATWHTETPYNDPDSPFTEAGRYDAKGRLQAVYRVTDANGKSVKISRGKRPFATVTFLLPRASREQSVVDPDGRDATFLFGKLTGLPRTLYPEPRVAGEVPDHQSPPRLEDAVSTRVTGVAEAIRLLTVPRRRRRR